MSINSFGHLFRLTTWGESHGPAIGCVVDGCPPGLPLTAADIQFWLNRRKPGQSRFVTQRREPDEVKILSGVFDDDRTGGPVTTGAPISLLIENVDQRGKDYDDIRDLYRPGHADYTYDAKYGLRDYRGGGRSSARETAARVAAGAIARQFLEAAGIRLTSHVFAVGAARLPESAVVSFDQAAALPDDGPFRCVDADVESRMIAEVDAAREAGDTRGGAFEVIATGVPPGLGSYTQWDRKLDGALAQALMSIPAIKAVGIGLGPEVAFRPGSRVHDEIVPDPLATHVTGVARPTNNAGGLEGGVTNGEDLRVSAWMKPISTLMKPLRSVDLTTMKEAAAAIERSDVCAVPAAAVVGEAMVALVLAGALVEKFGGDSMPALRQAMASSAEAARARFSPRSE
jgi:chorismate synthase